jgi:hypothetical protein
MKKVLKSNPFDEMRVNEAKDNREEYPLYPDSEDIYRKFREETSLDPEDISKIKRTERDEKEVLDVDDELNNDITGSDLDIPGSDLDDGQEMIGSEDEENNYYSLGGDNHNDLDEDKDELQN